MAARTTQAERIVNLEGQIDGLRFNLSEMKAEHNSTLTRWAQDSTDMHKGMQDKITAAEKSLADAKNTRDYYSRLNDEASKELSALHTILDFLPGAPPRKTTDAEYGSQQTVPLVARFAGFLAAKS